MLVGISSEIERIKLELVDSELLRQCWKGAGKVK